MPPSSIPYIERSAEIIAVFSVILGWRFRRSRLVLATVALAVANFLIRTSLSGEISAGFGPSLSALTIALPLNLAIVGLLPERKVSNWSTLAILAGIAVQPFLISRLLTLTSSQVEFAQWYLVMTTPQAGQLGFLIAILFTLLAFTIRRGIFELEMFGVLGSCALGLFGWPGVLETTVFFGAAQLILLFGLIEDSYELAFVDSLTGLPGRRAFDEALAGLGGVYTLAMIDIDRFKRFNDRFGHEAGDQALRMVAQSLQKIGGKAMVYRYGGEEFAAVFPSLPVVEAREHLEEVRRLIGSRTFSIRSPKRPKKRPDQPKAPRTEPARAKLTISIGVAGPSARRTESAEVLRAADKALYRAKRTGRNRLVSA